MQGGLLAYSADAPTPILIHYIVLTPNLLALVIVVLRDLDLGGRTRGARRC